MSDKRQAKVLSCQHSGAQRMWSRLDKILGFRWIRVQVPIYAEANHIWKDKVENALFCQLTGSRNTLIMQSDWRRLSPEWV